MGVYEDLNEVFMFFVHGFCSGDCLIGFCFNELPMGFYSVFNRFLMDF